MAPSRSRREPALREREFHRWLRATSKPPRPGELPMGDDVASLAVPRGRLLLTTDAFAEGTHFWPDSPARLVGSALVEANLSDLASKGGRPVAFLLDLLAPSDTPARWAREVVRGARHALAPYQVELSGGDTKPAAGRTLVGTAIGLATVEPVPGRGRARPGDLLAVTGTVGRGGAAAAALRKGDRGAVRRGLLRAIHARVAEGQRLARYAHAMVDTSDGVFEAARLISEASGRGVELDAPAIPLDRSVRARARRPDEQLDLAAYGGDYELLAALPRGSLGAAVRSLRVLGCPLTAIGRVTAGRAHRLRTSTGWRSLPAPGWDPFRPSLP